MKRAEQAIQSSRERQLVQNREACPATPVERIIDRCSINVDVAACIRWALFGIAAIIVAWHSA